MIDYLLCADWSKEQKGRSLYSAKVLTRKVSRVEEGELTVDFALKKARELAKTGNVFLSFDVPLGLPQSFLSELRNTPGCLRLHRVPSHCCAHSVLLCERA